MWKEVIRVEVTSLIDKRHVFEIVKRDDIPPKHQKRIYCLMILLKRKRSKFREISKYKCRQVMDGWRQIGNHRKMYHWDISVAFTSADAHQPTYVLTLENLCIQYTRDQNCLCSRGQDLDVIYGLSDSDFAGCKDASKSTSGYVVLLNGGAIAYYSGRQTIQLLCAQLWLRLLRLLSWYQILTSSTS